MTKSSSKIFGPGILDINLAKRDNKQAIIVNALRQANTQLAADLLAETLVNDLADLILEQYERVESVLVRVEKPEALHFADSVGGEIIRKRAE